MAETTISDLYEKYTNQVGEALEDDRYFQYLFEMVQAGDNTLEQKNRILHKVIDEQWLTLCRGHCAFAYPGQNLRDF